MLVLLLLSVMENPTVTGLMASGKWGSAGECVCGGDWCRSDRPSKQKGEVGAAFAARKQRRAADEAKRKRREAEALADFEARQQRVSNPSASVKLGSLKHGFKPSLRVGRS